MTLVTSCGQARGVRGARTGNVRVSRSDTRPLHACARDLSLSCCIVGFMLNRDRAWGRGQLLYVASSQAPLSCVCSRKTLDRYVAPHARTVCQPRMNCLSFEGYNRLTTIFTLRASIAFAERFSLGPFIAANRRTLCTSFCNPLDVILSYSPKHSRAWKRGPYAVTKNPTDPLSDTGSRRNRKDRYPTPWTPSERLRPTHCHDVRGNVAWRNAGSESTMSGRMKDPCVSALAAASSAWRTRLNGWK